MILVISTTLIISILFAVVALIGLAVVIFRVLLPSKQPEKHPERFDILMTAIDKRRQESFEELSLPMMIKGKTSVTDNYANMREAEERFYTENIKPVIECLRERLIRDQVERLRDQDDIIINRPAQYMEQPS